MLVYCDRSETAEPRACLQQIRSKLDSTRAIGSGIERHSKLVAALVEAGRLLQGVADAGIHNDDLERFVHDLAKAVVRSFDTDLDEAGDLPSIPALNAPALVGLRLPEGFAFYGVYPEDYVEAARRLRLSAPPMVIGIRSIGTTLGAVVAAALQAPPAITVRPIGDPFHRRAELPDELIDLGAHYVIVDEGPGLSGSSFGSVADALESRGVALDHIAFIPGHDHELGPRSSKSHRDRWQRAQREVAQFSPKFLEKAFGKLTPFSIGRPGERRKYLALERKDRMLLKFAGLGEFGERKFAIARTLHAAGLTPEPLCIVHGFLAERWCENGRPLLPNEKPVNEIGRYVGARSRLLPARGAGGASIEELSIMVRRNLSLVFGEQVSSAFSEWNLEQLPSRVERIVTDNKLDRCEWLRLPNDLLLKTDALDHHCGHDLVGCQDITWDVAGAITEFDLDEREARLLEDEVERASGRCIDEELLEFLSLAYASFRLGEATLAAEACEKGTATHLSLLERVSRYAVRARALLHQHHLSGTPRNSSVD